MVSAVLKFCDEIPKLEVSHVGYPAQTRKSVSIRRPRKANDKAIEKTESLLSASGANLMYAGYPYDPFT